MQKHDNLKLWQARWKRWRAYADRQTTVKKRLWWILDYQWARRVEMGKGR